MAYKWIELTITDRIAEVGLNRTEKLNALSYELATEITDVFHELSANRDVWVVILKSNARIFSAGLDLVDAASRGIVGSAKHLLDIPERERNIFECCHAIEECKKPVIATVHGMCVGAGLDIIAACDIRVCSEDASFSLREARIGICADMGVLQRLPFIIGQANTRLMAYTGKFFAASEVAQMGLVQAIYPDREMALAGARQLAEDIKECAPLGVQSTKEVLNYSRFVSVRDGITLAVHKNMILLASSDCREAIAAFMEKRKPVFKGE